MKQTKTGRRALLYAVGCIAPPAEHQSACFQLLKNRLAEADVAFCQLGLNLTRGGTRLPQAQSRDRGNPALASHLKEAGFGIVSLAGDVCLDWGREGFSETLEHLTAAGLRTVGVGADVKSARAPTVCATDGSDIAFLAYSCIMPAGYWAEERRPGCAPMRAHTFYEQVEEDQPGTPARIHVFPHRDDLKALTANILEAKRRAEVVVLSLQWRDGDAGREFIEFQREVAHAAAAAGADLILGHDAHAARSIETYGGVPIVYGLPDFVTEVARATPDGATAADQAYAMSMVVKAVIQDSRIESLALLPVVVNGSAQPMIIDSHDARFEDFRRELDGTRDSDASSCRLETRGDELVVLL